MNIRLAFKVAKGIYKDRKDAEKNRKFERGGVRDPDWYEPVKEVYVMFTDEVMGEFGVPKFFELSEVEVK